MRLLTQKEFERDWHNLIYAPKQLGALSIDLTVHAILEMKPTLAVLDFGGSEYQGTEREPIPPRLADDPKYGWWQLKTGHYFVQYNETPPAKGITIVYPHERLIRAGCYHTPFVIAPSSSEPTKITLESLLVVGSNGVRIKENARISTAITMLL